MTPNAPETAEPSVKSRKARARSFYQHYECDHCHARVGWDGMVRLRTTDTGKLLVWGARCQDCAEAGKRL